MVKLGPRRFTQPALMVMALAIATPALRGAAPPATPGPAATAPASSAPASATPSTPAKRPTVDELLAARQPVAFEFINTSVSDILAYMAKNYDVQIVDKYEHKELLTIPNKNPQTARDAIRTFDDAMIGTGYVLAESVVGDPPRVVLTVVPTKTDAGALTRVYYDNDPASIPEGDIRRTQVLSYVAVDPDVAHNMIVAVVGKQTEVQVNTSNKTITITDTGTHVRSAAALLQALEKQAAGNK